jgi:hypothetical protein
MSEHSALDSANTMLGRQKERTSLYDLTDAVRILEYENTIVMGQIRPIGSVPYMTGLPLKVLEFAQPLEAPFRRVAHDHCGVDRASRHAHDPIRRE